LASEINVSARLSFYKSGAGSGLESAGAFTLTGTKYQEGRQSVGTSQEALNLGDVAAGGWCFIINRDATNYVKVRPATGATDLIRIKAGEFALFRLDAGAAAPFVIADTAAVEIQYLILVD